jgi:hypothetical protein
MNEDEDRELKVIQVLTKINTYCYNRNFEFSSKEVELYSNEFHFYEGKLDKYDVDSFGSCEYFVEVYLPINSTAEEIEHIKKQSIQLLIEYFESKIENLNESISLLKKQ